MTSTVGVKSVYSDEEIIDELNVLGVELNADQLQQLKRGEKTCFKTELSFTRRTRSLDRSRRRR